MKRLIVVCEGPTEKEFCKNVLQNFFWQHGIVLETPVVKHSGGGVVPWPTLKVQLVNHLRDNDAYTTMFIDYYGIKDDFLFPKWGEAKSIANHEQRMEFLEKAMLQDVPEMMQQHFIPHLQLHEFESLLFADITAFEKNFMSSEMDMKKLKRIVSEFPNPEEINNNPKTAPSKRLEDAIRGYQKVLFGNCVAMDIGINKMMAACPHFCKWINRLVTVVG
jgi:hypothetical protein